MKKNQGILVIVKLFALAASVFFLSRCTTEEDLIPIETKASATETTAAATEGEADVASITVSGVYTEVAEITDCSTCTYVVPANAIVIDGKELGLAPGSVICMDKAIRYKALEFINLEGTVESPVTISYCGK